MKIDLVVGARPNYMKAAPVYHELKRYPDIFQCQLIHTGQHYDSNMSKIFFDQLGLPEPDIYLGVGSGLQGEQTGKIMITYESTIINDRPDLTLVVGDVNSTMACSLVAVKLQIKVGHIEAGLRSRDWSMPEEINRVVTDRVSDLLFTTSRDANENLIQEGISEDKIFFVGNTMIDSLKYYLSKTDSLDILSRFRVEPQGYALVTLHRPSNVDRSEIFRGIIGALGEIQEHLPVIFPIHPRSKRMMLEFGIDDITRHFKNLIITDPLGYLEFLKLEKEAAVVLTDSGGIQEETTAMGVPCLTLRENTERPITVTEGTNEVVGSNMERIVNRAMSILKGERKVSKVPELWDGHSAERIVEILRRIDF